MSSSAGGKKGRKKMKTVPLNEFLGPSEGVIMVKSVSSWADEVDEVEPIVGGVTKVSLPSAPRSSMPLEIDERSLPSSPPYTVRLNNLSYEIRESDVEDFFRDMKVCSIKLLRENNDPNGRINGTGFVEFEDKESLIMALSMPTKMLRGRQLFIEVSDTYGDPRQRRRIIDDINKSIPGDDEDRTSGDWRMNKPSQQPRERQDSHDRRRNNYDDRYDRRDDGDRRGGDRNFRGFDNFRRDDRNFRRDGGGGGYERRGDDDRGGGGYRDNRGGGYRRDYGDRRDDRGYRQDDGRRGDSFRDRRDGGFEDRRSYRNDDGYRRNDDRRDEMSRHEEEDDSANRPRLMLEKRTAPEPVGSVARGSSSIFGQAKPVDTYKKEKEIEDRLMIKKTAEPAPRPQRPSSSSIFGDAKPVDTSEKIKQVENRLMKLELEKGQLDEGEGEKKKMNQHHYGKGGDGGGGSNSRTVHRSQDSRRVERSSDSEERNKRDSASPPPQPSKTINDEPPTFIGSNKYSTLEESD
ncbi:uncharacterized protein [Lepeophtheirus salmonis]|uniref:Eukaryotic initiation factor 4B [Nasonia vitripennis] n=1 Tax=Lepeophtheirus salmonis TaxID=72036 RepID=A0A0K2TFT7_LEPSM|nr:eukaryotic translation initiation factor 4B-like isoform X2 [Lepeophtheirus salmonis]